MSTLSELFFTSIEGLLVIFAFALLSGKIKVKNLNKLSFVFFTLIYTIYTYWITLFIPAGVHSLFISLLTLLTLNYLFRGKIYISLIKTFLIFTFISVVEILISIFGLIITSVPLNLLLENETYLFICSIISKLIEFTCLIIFYKKPLNISWLNDTNPFKSRYKEILVFISAFMVLLVCANIFLSDNPDKAYLFNIFSFIIYLILIIAMLSAFHEGSKLELLQYANELQKENVQQLIEFNEMVAKERHEYKNHLNTILGLCTLNKEDSTERIKQYISKYANSSSTKNILIDSGIDFVDAVINVKYNNGQRRGIDLRVKFDEPLTSADIKEDVAVTVISNIIENAFEAMYTYDKQNKFVLLHTYFSEGRYFISISNNGPVISEADQLKIFNAGYSTKDNPSKTRGFGLSIVKSEVIRCNGSLSLKSNQEETEFLISFKAKSKVISQNFMVN